MKAAYEEVVDSMTTRNTNPGSLPYESCAGQTWPLRLARQQALALGLGLSVGATDQKRFFTSLLRAVSYLFERLANVDPIIYETSSAALARTTERSRAGSAFHKPINNLRCHHLSHPGH